MSTLLTTNIVHPKITDINVTWCDEKMLVQSIFINDSKENIKLVDNDYMKLRFKELFDFLQNYGKYDEAIFPIEWLDFSKVSPFNRQVYRKLYATKKGDILTYSELAVLAGSPRACRAVGSAMSRNKFLLAIPCHRVIGKTYLGNFTAGIAIKKLVLTIDGRADVIT